MQEQDIYHIFVLCCSPPNKGHKCTNGWSLEVTLLNRQDADVYLEKLKTTVYQGEHNIMVVKTQSGKPFKSSWFIRRPADHKGLLDIDRTNDGETGNQTERENESEQKEESAAKKRKIDDSRFIMLDHDESDREGERILDQTIRTNSLIGDQSCMEHYYIDKSHEQVK